MPLAVAITGFGMRSSIGVDTISACAALRAGIVRARELSHLIVLNEDGTPEHPVGHPVEMAHGFQGMAKLLALAMPAFQEVLSQGSLRSLLSERIGLYLALPPHAKPQKAASRQGSREISLCDRLTQLVRFPISTRNQREFWCGHAGVSLALEQALQDLASGRLEHCIVGGVDSLLDGQTVDTLHKQRRLKSQDAPDGFQPGEAAAFLLLESPRSALRRGVHVHGLITGVASALEEKDEDKRVPGATLARALGSLLPARLDAGERVWFISDLNGEPGRAVEWGNLLVRLTQSHPEFRQAPLWHPASSLGDTGAASAAIGMCAAVRSFARKYAPAETALILSSSDGPERGVIRVERYTVRQQG